MVCQEASAPIGLGLVVLSTCSGNIKVGAIGIVPRVETTVVTSTGNLKTPETKTWDASSTLLVLILHQWKRTLPIYISSLSRHQPWVGQQTGSQKFHDVS